MVVSQWLDVPSTDPNDARRRKLLNILLVGMGILTLLVILAVSVGPLLGFREGLLLLYGGSFAMLLAVVLVFVINRYWSGEVASSVFLLVLTFLPALVDKPRQVVDGRTLWMFAIPVIMASVLLRPWASFIAAGLVSVLLTIIALSVSLVPNLIATLGFFALALVSWLPARIMERTLEDLRVINRELDQRVEERTQDLAIANRSLAAANARLKELDRLKSRFLSIVSHELRTPLNAVLGFSEMLEAGVYGPLSEKQVGAMERIVANTKRQLGLVNDLLDQAQIEAGTLSLNYAFFSPTDLLDDIHATMSVLAETKNLQLTCDIATDVPAMLSGDRQRLQQILMNLVNNAIKFTECGAVHVSAYLPDEEHWMLQVSDTGTGIPEEAQPYIFDAFHRVDTSTTREHRGVGLGLAIVKQLTNLMGGKISLESRVGLGSTFTVELPLRVPTKEGAL